jgi:hypothetical protein
MMQPHCASNKHDDKPAVWYLEAGGVGSYYCGDCGAAIMRSISGGTWTPVVQPGGERAAIRGMLGGFSRDELLRAGIV